MSNSKFIILQRKQVTKITRSLREAKQVNSTRAKGKNKGKMTEEKKEREVLREIRKTKMTNQG